MSIIVWIIFGAIAGWIASLLAGTDENQGLVANIIVGVIGAFIGGWLMNMIGKSGVNGFNLYSMLVAIGGAIILLMVYKAIAHR